MEFKALFVIMRTLSAIALVIFLAFPAKARSQQISLSFKNSPLETVMKSIEHQTGVRFIYSREQLLSSIPVSIRIRNTTLEEALKACFMHQPVSYTIDGNYIVLRNISATGKDSANVVRGKVSDEKGLALAGVTVMISRNRKMTFTNEKGEFVLKEVLPEDTLVFTSVNMETIEEAVLGRSFMVIVMRAKIMALGDVTVLYNTGYQNVPKERATGSFDYLSNQLVNRSVSSDILSRIDGVASGVLFNKNITPSANESTFSIRGRSTIFANPQPLIVVDNFPYDGDISNINPNDVESITILKDAAAASIWGARSGNGVVVITTKKGSYNHAPKISANSNLTLAARPDLYYLPAMSSSDYIGLEQNLFNQGYFDGAIANGYSFLSPVVDLLNQQREGLITADSVQNAIQQFKKMDIRRDLKNYYYQPALTQQYAVNISGGSANDHYYFSAGYDHSNTSLAKNEYKRITVNASNTYAFWNQKLELSSNIVLSSTTNRNNNNGSPGIGYPYASLADASGNALPVFPDYRKGYLDTAGQGLLQNWYDYPLRELQYADNRSQVTEYKLGLMLNYKMFRGMNASFSYQYLKGTGFQNNLYSQQTYYTRNLINQFAQVDNSSGNVDYPVPPGAILDKNQTDYFSHNLRAQISYSNKLGSGMFNGIAGWELKSYEFTSGNSRLYGYDPANATSVGVDYVDYFPSGPLGVYSTIPNNIAQSGNTDHFLSYFANMAYTLRDKYTVSASARADASNLFGVNTNQKTIPLWSAGISWEISKENFYSFSFLPLLKLKLTDGYNGNVNKNVSAYTTALYMGTNIFNANYSSIVNPPNPSLRWEKINMVNIGLDFATRHNRLTGSLEYYQKYGSDIIGNSPLAPQTGVIQFTGNTAGIIAHGADLTLTALISTRKFKWNTQFLLSYVNTVVSKYELKQPAPVNYVSGNYINPMEGKPYSALFSYRWAGLSSQNGAPQGYLNGQPSTDYASLINPSSVQDLVYNGPASPRYFGSLLNNIGYGPWKLSFNITYKTGAVFRRNSISYSGLFSSMLSGGSPGHADYSIRWQQPGDETHTIVPSMDYPASPTRDQFYLNSAALIDKAGLVRFQDLRISYSLKLPSLHVDLLDLYIYINNIGLLWKANRDGIDPDYINSIPNPMSISMGLKIEL